MLQIGKPRVRDVTTLAIEASDVRFLVSERGRVASWGSVELPNGLVTNGLITDPTEMGAILDEMFATQQLSRRRVVTALTGLRSIPRVLNLPKLQASLMAETIAREARKEMPLSLDDLYLSWDTIGSQGEMQRIYLLGVPRDLMDAQVQALEAANIPPYVMDLKPLALIRAIDQPEAVVVNLECASLDIILVRQYQPAIMRTFSLEEDGLSNEGRLDQLVNELVQTTRFYNESYPNAMIPENTPLYMTGRLLAGRDAREYVAVSVEYPVAPNPTPIETPRDMPVAEYMTNLGLTQKKV
ncbi:MAG: pilus assembly protein PilM [Anaerolineae bacterium]|nr:pilus assembly protein PilM [Anaerolineae bacterium]